MRLMMPTTKKSNAARRILGFDSFKKLTFVVQSQVKLAKMLGVATPTIRGVCNGNAISTCGYYLRWWDQSIEIDVSTELGVLTLQEYDKLLGVKRTVYNDSKMTRKSLRMKYNMKATPEKLRKLQRNEGNQNSSNQQL